MRRDAALIAALLVPAGVTAAVAATACRAPDGAVLAIEGNRIVRWPEGAPVWAADRGTAAALACEGEQIVVAVAEGRSALLLRLPAGGEGPAREIGRLRGRPAALLVRDGAAILLAARRARGSLALFPDGVTRPVTRDLAASGALALAPDGDAVFVGEGQRIRSFTLPGLRSWFVYPVGRPIERLASRNGESRLLVATREGVLLLDLRDRPGRGTMPVHGEAAVGALLDLCWLGGEPPVAAVLLEQPRELLFLGGTRLTPLGSVPLGEEARALLPGPARTVSVVRAGAPPVEIALPEEALARAAAARAAAREARSRKPPVATPAPLPETAPVRPPAGATPAPRATPLPPAKAPAAPVPSPLPKAPEPPPSRTSPRAAPAPPPTAGTIAGRISGRTGLVEAVVLVGPDNLLDERARVPPERAEDGTVRFEFRGLPPGHYRVMLFGKGGASLATRPPVQDVRVEEGHGIRADFDVRGPL